MPSDRKKKQQREKANKKGAASKNAPKDDNEDEIEEVTEELGQVDVHDSQNRSCTGVLASHPQSRDIHIESFTMLFHGHELLADTQLELNFGRRYGLIGPNGCGKSCLLRAIAARDIPIPNHIDIYLLDREAPATDMTALEMVKSVDKEKERLEKEAEQLVEMEMTEDVEQRMSDVYERCVPFFGDLLQSSCIAEQQARARPPAPYPTSASRVVPGVWLTVAGRAWGLNDRPPVLRQLRDKTPAHSCRLTCVCGAGWS